jgi:hypothetical protein
LHRFCTPTPSAKPCAHDRRGGNRVRITAQLIDAVSGKHLWAERYDRSLEHIFAVQDEVTQRIVAVLPARVEAAALERASRKTSNSLRYGMSPHHVPPCVDAGAFR